MCSPAQSPKGTLLDAQIYCWNVDSVPMFYPGHQHTHRHKVPESWLNILSRFGITLQLAHHSQKQEPSPSTRPDTEAGRVRRQPGSWNLRLDVDRLIFPFLVNYLRLDKPRFRSFESCWLSTQGLAVLNCQDPSSECRAGAVSTSSTPLVLAFAFTCGAGVLFSV